MNEQVRTVKTNIGSVTDVIIKHVADNNKNIKNKRQERMEKLRKESAVECMDIKKLIETFPVNEFLNTKEPIEICNTLLQILKTKDIDEFYAKSNMYYENMDGPFLFENKNVFNKLLSLLGCTTNIPLLTCVSHILILISSHEETLTWTSRILPALPLIVTIIDNCPITVIRENLIWTLSNMCIDHSSINKIVYPKTITTVTNNLMYAIKNEQWDIISVCAFYLKGILSHKQDSPDISQIIKLWKLIMEDIYLNEYFEISDIDITYELITKCISVAVKISDSYRLSILNDENLIKRIINPLSNETKLLIIHADILGCLLWSQQTHIPLIKMGVINLFKMFLFDKQPTIREEGATSLAILASCPAALPELMTDSFLLTIQKVLIRTDLRRVANQMKMLFCTLLLHKESRNMYERIIPMISYFDEILHENYDLLLLITGLKALLELCKWNRTIVQEQIEAFDGITQLDKLSVSKNEEVNDLAIKIINRFNENVMDLSE